MHRTAAFVALLASSTLFAADTIVDYHMPDRGIAAERGSSRDIPENTLASFRDALMRGAQMITLDVRLSKDGQVVVIADESLERTTNGQGLVAERTVAELQKLSAGKGKGRRYANQRIPTLKEALAMMPENVNLLLTIPSTEAVAPTVELATQTQRSHQCIFAGTADVAKAVIAIDAKANICLTSLGNFSVRDIKGQGYFLNTNPGRLRAMNALTNANVVLIQGGITEAKQIEQAFEAGARFVLSNAPQTSLVASDMYGIERLNAVYRKDETTEKSTPVFKDGEAQEVAEFKKAEDWIHQDLWVETEFDTDGDGRKDRMHVSVARQKQTDTQGLKVPVVYNSSPYFSGTAKGKDFFWDPKHELGEEPPTHADPPQVAFQSRRLVISPRHWGDWLPRGYAIVHSASPGTGLSQGCVTIGGKNESLGPKAVIDWLCGRSKGFTTPNGNREVTAYWCTGNIGMTGTSYNGTIPLAAATTGVEGLKAIIPVAPNTSYYHYYRSNGMVRHPGGYMGEDIDVLYNFVNSGNPANREYCDCEVRDKEMAEGFDRKTGDYNDFWAGRDYLNQMQNMKAALLMAHAFNDWNVMPEHSVRIYQKAKQMGLPTQCYFHQGGHGGPPPIKQMNRWFTRYLFDIENNVENDPQAWVVRERAERLKPTPYNDYPNPEAKPVTLRPGKGGATAGTLVQTLTAAQGVEELVDDASVAGSELAQKESDHRLLYITPELKRPVHLSGLAKMKIRIAANKPAANLSVWLVSLPWNKESGTMIYDNIITRGWMDPKNHSSLTDEEPLKIDQFYDLEFDLQPDDHIVPAGQQIGLMIFSSDKDFTLWPDPGTEVSVDLDQTSLTLPVVGGAASFEAAVSP